MSNYHSKYIFVTFSLHGCVPLYFSHIVNTAPWVVVNTQNIHWYLLDFDETRIQLKWSCS